MRNVVLLVLAIGLTLESNAQASEDRIARSLSVRWELLNNFYQGKRQMRCVLTFYNTGNEAIPSSGWSLYYNALSGPPSGKYACGLSSQDLSGCLYRLQPSGDFKGIKAGDSLKLEYVSANWAVNISDAPNGWYVVSDNAPSKGLSLAHYARTPITSSTLFDRFPGDKVPEATPDHTYHLNQQSHQGDAPDVLPLFPTPRSMTLLPDSSAYYKGGTIVVGNPQFEKEAAYLQRRLKEKTGKEIGVSNSMETGDGIYLLSTPDSLGEEGYKLSISGGKIRIEASAPAGMFYGIQTLMHLIPVGSTILPALRITDQPRFGYRALMIDVGRNFQTQKEILRVIDLMAFCKLNVLHLHLTDDEGWRLEIPSLPELTTFGSKRGHTLDEQNWLKPCYGSGPDTSSPSGSGFYTRAQFIEILRYAMDRHIRVIPEIESPGHARAAVKAMDSRYRHYMKEGRKEEAVEFLLRDTADQSVYATPQYYHDNVMNVALPSVYRFIGRVTSEVVGMYKEAGVPLESIHLGGDEVPGGVWEKSPACLALMKQGRASTVADLWYYYFDKVDSILRSQSLYTSAWEEAGMRKTLVEGKPYILPNPDFARRGMQVHIWNNGDGAEDLAYRMANAGYKVVLSVASHLYFDMSYNKSFDEFGYYWATFQDLDKPFSYIPFDFLRLLKEDAQGNPYPPGFKATKEKLTEYGKSNIVGMEGCLWGETLLSAADLEYKLLPKVLGTAERAWAPDPQWATSRDTAAAMQAYNDAWFVFTSTLGRQILPELDAYNTGYAYRIPPPGVIVKDGKVWANGQFPGMDIRYTTNGKEVNAQSARYTGPISAKGVIRLRVFDTVGRGSREVEVTNE